jgi:hypothetical protein
MAETKQPKRGRPSKPGKTPFNFRISDGLRRRLVFSAENNGRSLAEEAELRLNRDFAWETSKQNIDDMKRDAAKWREADFLNVLRFVGYQILRETDGRPTRVIVDLQSLFSEIDGLVAGLRSGFTPSSLENRPRTADEERRLVEELERLRREIDKAIERTRS